MVNIDLSRRIKEIYENGENIIDFLKNMDGRTSNTVEDILISYDFQAGSYIKLVQQNPSLHEEYTAAIAKVLNQLRDFDSILEVGVGEATTLSNLAAKLSKDVKLVGFDISWSRVNCGRQYLKEKNIVAQLFVADLFKIPLNDSSIDIVYTAHSVEPNGGREKEALKELYRVAGKYLVLLEPSNEFADEEGKDRMKKLGYIQNLSSVINDLGYDLVEYRPFEVSKNPLNPTALYVIRKGGGVVNTEVTFHCPISRDKLKEYDDHFYSPQSLVSYPKIMGIPCLCSAYGILTAKHE